MFRKKLRKGGWNDEECVCSACSGGDFSTKRQVEREQTRKDERVSVGRRAVSSVFGVNWKRDMNERVRAGG
jgi:hypothetical protein